MIRLHGNGVHAGTFDAQVAGSGIDFMPVSFHRGPLTGPGLSSSAAHSSISTQRRPCGRRVRGRTVGGQPRGRSRLQLVGGQMHGTGTTTVTGATTMDTVGAGTSTNLHNNGTFTYTQAEQTPSSSRTLPSSTTTTLHEHHGRTITIGVAAARSNNFVRSKRTGIDSDVFPRFDNRQQALFARP